MIKTTLPSPRPWTFDPFPKIPLKLPDTLCILLTQKEVAQLLRVSEHLDDAIHEAGVAQVIQSGHTRADQHLAWLGRAQRRYHTRWLLHHNKKQ